MNADRKAVIVVGVVPDQPEAVVAQASTFARAFDARLLCCLVDRTRYVVEELPDGHVRALPIDPDLPELSSGEFDPVLKKRLAVRLDGAGIAWEARLLAGDPAWALGRLAEVTDALMIVVGTHKATVRGSLGQFFNGSVAAHLAHRQHRPVMVIPLNPVPADRRLPWEAA